jgi:hypothetical protein
VLLVIVAVDLAPFTAVAAATIVLSTICLDKIIMKDFTTSKNPS